MSVAGQTTGGVARVSVAGKTPSRRVACQASYSGVAVATSMVRVDARVCLVGEVGVVRSSGIGAVGVAAAESVGSV